MCGILGVLPVPDQPAFQKALNAMAQRGPDGEGSWQHPQGHVQLGHRRLAIIDLGSGGRQPMRRGALTITANSEFYNYPEVRRRLEALGQRFVTQSDTEVFLAAWQQWGPAALAEFNGMWAFGMWDDSRQSLILARDRFGKQPLYYFQEGGRFGFASQMKPLFNFLQSVRPAANFRELAADLRGYEATEHCLIAGIKRFPAGHWGEYRNGKLELHRYWSTLEHRVEVPATYAEQVARFRELWEDACRLRLRADVPVVASLSGGLDSASVVGTLVGMRPETPRLQTFTVEFPGTVFDESAAARTVAEAVGADFNAIAATAPEPDLLRKQMREFEELHDNCISPKVALYAGMKTRGKSVSVDGHGADELLSGYGEGLFHAFGDAGFNVRAWREIIRAFNDFYPGHPQFAKARARFSTALAYRWGGGGQELPGELKRTLGHHGAYLYQLYHERIFPVMLRNYERYAMMCGVEIRMPFTDHRLVSYAFSLPWEARLRGGFTKAILRDAMQGVVPEAIRQKRQKVGFPTPILAWMRGPWREWLEDWTASRAFLESDLADGPWVRQEVQAVLNQARTDYFTGLKIWGRLAPLRWEWALLQD
ncbi:MAG: asparagine synthase (glutamine-hydrolyzing) [Bacteroidota bacterium]